MTNFENVCFGLEAIIYMKINNIFVFEQKTNEKRKKNRYEFPVNKFSSLGQQLIQAMNTVKKNL